ncbi:hypothetical protein CRYUN_Cryun39dG0076000 [Craigia yunnanensis]
MVASPQVLYDCGIITVFDGRNEGATKDVSLNGAGRRKISITMPPNSSQKIRCLKSIIILSTDNDKIFEYLPRIEIVNETKDTKWTYSKHFIGIPETKNTLFWLTSWKFRGDELEAGDHISLTVLSDLRVIESCIDIVYDYELYDKWNTLDQLRSMNKCSSFLSGIFAYAFFKSQRTLYRMQSLSKVS